MDRKAKKHLNYGEEYVNRSRILKKKKVMGPPCKKCRLKCMDKLSEEIRKNLFSEYWQLGDHTRQWDFIARWVKITEKKVGSLISRRKFSRKYYFPLEKDEIQVCKTMFLQTLSISEKIVSTVSSKLELSPTIEADKRGRHSNRPFRISNEIKECVQEHISLFPVVDSHYTRENTKKQYLDSDLNISKMHRLYSEWVKKKEVSEKTQNVTLRQYQDIFNTFTNISFFKPKKDLCDTCEKYKISTPEEKESQQVDYNEHLSNKDIARQKKIDDKQRGISEPNLCVAAFDLEKVLTTPQGEVSNFYYKRKFATYNFTIFDIAKKLGYCFMWNEAEAKRGANEIATCLFKFMTMMKKDRVTEFIFYSDNCGGQNRNRFLFSMWEYAAFALKVKITHRFLERGHTQNEGDSMHACIENSKKGKTIYVPVQWITLVRCAKVTGKPYLVTEVSNEDFLNFKGIVEDKSYNWTKTVDGCQIRWSCIKEIMVTFDKPFILSIKYNLTSPDFIIIDIKQKKQKGRYQPRCLPVQAYTEKIAIDKAKYNDLISLCEMGLIPTTYHTFYKSLTSR